jgi:hypothetical protein
MNDSARIADLVLERNSTIMTHRGHMDDSGLISDSILELGSKTVNILMLMINSRLIIFLIQIQKGTPYPHSHSSSSP